MRGLAVMVAATPCPLILGVPVAIVSGLSRCAGRGVLVKGGGALERLARARTLFIDKTGTLTGGRARVAAIETALGVADDDLLRLAREPRPALATRDRRGRRRRRSRPRPCRSQFPRR